MVVSRIRRSFVKEEKGAVLIEMTLLLPFMLLLSAGVFEFSNILHTRLLVEAGVEDAARYIARCYRSNTVKAACETAAENLAVTGTTDGTGAARVTACDPAWTASAVIPTYTQYDAIDDVTLTRNYLTPSDHVDVVQVKTSCRYVGTGLLAYLGFSPLTISMSHQERVLGW